MPDTDLSYLHDCCSTIKRNDNEESYKYKFGQLYAARCAHRDNQRRSQKSADEDCRLSLRQLSLQHKEGREPSGLCT